MTKRVIIYEMIDGTEATTEIPTVEMEQHERAAAEMEVRSKGTLVRGYRFAWQDEDATETITTLENLRQLLAELPEGTTVNILGSDLEAGNFDTASFLKPSGEVIEVTYTGPVAEGYVSPFEVSR